MLNPKFEFFSVLSPFLKQKDEEILRDTLWCIEYYTRLKPEKIDDFLKSNGFDLLTDLVVSNFDDYVLNPILKCLKNILDGKLFTKMMNDSKIMKVFRDSMNNSYHIQIIILDILIKMIGLDELKIIIEFDFYSVIFNQFLGTKSVDSKIFEFITKSCLKSNDKQIEQIISNGLFQMFFDHLDELKIDEHKEILTILQLVFKKNEKMMEIFFDSKDGFDLLTIFENELVEVFDKEFIEIYEKMKLKE